LGYIQMSYMDPTLCGWRRFRCGDCGGITQKETPAGADSDWGHTHTNGAAYRVKRGVIFDANGVPNEKAPARRDRGEVEKGTRGYPCKRCAKADPYVA
jgi:hypothetical protein